MAFNHDVADRLQTLVGYQPGFEETRMFGGFGYLLNGNMCVGIQNCDLILRLGKQNVESLHEKYCDLREMDFTGRAMKGWAMIDGLSCEDEDFVSLVQESLDFVTSLPHKTAKINTKRKK